MKRIDTLLSNAMIRVDYSIIGRDSITTLPLLRLFDPFRGTYAPNRVIEIVMERIRRNK